MVGPAHKTDLDDAVQCPVCGRKYGAELETCPVDGARLLSVQHLSVSGVGAVLGGRYHIDSILGQGGMATVFSAVQQPIGRRVAVKVLHPDLAKDETFVTRFHTEAKAASVLVNPNTVTIHDFGRAEDGTLYIAMEHLEGVSLADRLELGPMHWRHAAAVSVQVCRALAEAHRKGIVHRDLKPENIMLLTADDGTLLVKVLDFGIAKMLHRPGTSMTGLPVTQVGVIIGTPQYMSPEQAQGKEPSSASDLYALGVILHECIAGAPPFDHDEHILLLGMQIQSKPPPLESPRGEIPPALRGLVDGLLAKDPAARPGPADQVGATLRQLIGAKPPTAAEVLEDLEPPGGTPPPRPVPPIPPEVAAAAKKAGASVDVPVDGLRDESEVEPTRMVASPPGPQETSGSVDVPVPVEESRIPEETALLSVVVEPASPEAAGLRPDQVLPEDAVVVLGEEDLYEEELTPIVARPRNRGVLFVLIGIIVVAAGAVTGVALWATRTDAPPGSTALLTADDPGGSGAEGPTKGGPQVGSVGGAASPAAGDEAGPAGGQLDAGSSAAAVAADASPASSDSAAPPPAAATEVADGGLEQMVSINSRPGGVQVYLGSKRLCTTPCRTLLVSGERVTLDFKRRGYRQRSRTFVPGPETEITVEMRRGRKTSDRPPRTKTKRGDPFGLW